MTTEQIKTEIGRLRADVAQIMLLADSVGDTVLQELAAAISRHLSDYDLQQESYSK